MRTILALSLAALLSACASVPNPNAPRVDDGIASQGTQIRADMAQCWQWGIDEAARRVAAAGPAAPGADTAREAQLLGVHLAYQCLSLRGYRLQAPASR